MDQGLKETVHGQGRAQQKNLQPKLEVVMDP
jgi:hypothetical protein